MNLSVVAEGAEIGEEIDFLQHEKCDRVQGFYFSKALPFDLILGMDFNSMDDSLILRSVLQTYPACDAQIDLPVSAVPIALQCDLTAARD